MTVKISRLYNDFSSAKAAVQRLEAAGLSSGDISILASNADGWYDSKGKPADPDHSAVDPKHDKDRDGHDDRAEGATTGGGIGAVAGGGIGALTGLGLLAIPGVGPVVAAGWLAATIAGAVAGGAAGGIVGALAETGVDKQNAELYAESLRRGGAIVTARVSGSDQTKYAAILDQSAVDVTTRATAYRAAGWKGYDSTARPYNADEARRERAQY